jgi:hypothetical protein
MHCAIDTDVGAMVSPPQQRKRDPPKIIPRSPLPARKRALHPGAPDMVRPRRSPGQVTADNQRAKDRKRDSEKLAQKNIETLAQMDIQQEIDDREEEARAIQRLSDVERLENLEAKTKSAGSESEGPDSAEEGPRGGGNGYGSDTEPGSGAEVGDGYDDTTSGSDVEVVPAQSAPEKTNVS